MFLLENNLIIIWGGGCIFLCLPPFNSNFPYFKRKFLVPRTSNLPDSTVICVLPSLAIIWLRKRAGPKVIKLFSCSTQLSTKIIMLINVKMPTIVGILIFISMINTTLNSLKAREVFIFQHFSLYEQLKFHAQLC